MVHGCLAADSQTGKVFGHQDNSAMDSSSLRVSGHGDKKDCSVLLKRKRKENAELHQQYSWSNRSGTSFAIAGLTFGDEFMPIRR